MSNTGDDLCGDHALTRLVVVVPSPPSTTSTRTTRPLLDAQNTLLAFSSIAIAVIASPSPSSRASSLDRLVVAAAPLVVSRLANAHPPSLVAHAYVTNSVTASDDVRPFTRRFPSRISRPSRASSSSSPSRSSSSSPPPPVPVVPVPNLATLAPDAIAIGAPLPT
tara:strand:+ start:3297 stop:3791 length:495 start_codon:yes stop_codon:yes gene_type:complete